VFEAAHAGLRGRARANGRRNVSGDIEPELAGPVHDLEEQVFGKGRVDLDEIGPAVDSLRAS
jgi:hypothetical protein